MPPISVKALTDSRIFSPSAYQVEGLPKKESLKSFLASALLTSLEYLFATSLVSLASRFSIYEPYPLGIVFSLTIKASTTDGISSNVAFRTLPHSLPSSSLSIILYSFLSLSLPEPSRLFCCLSSSSMVLFVTLVSDEGTALVSFPPSFLLVPETCSPSVRASCCASFASVFRTVPSWACVVFPLLLLFASCCVDSKAANSAFSLTSLVCSTALLKSASFFLALLISTSLIGTIAASIATIFPFLSLKKLSE